MSMICAPPMIVLISDAWPGQSTRVNCSLSYPEPAAPRACVGPSLAACRLAYGQQGGDLPLSRSGTCVMNAENPRSMVIPFAWLCGLLSSAAVDSSSLSARTGLDRHTPTVVTRRHHTTNAKSAPCRRTEACLPAVNMAEHTNIDIENLARGNGVGHGDSLTPSRVSSRRGTSARAVVTWTNYLYETFRYVIPTLAGALTLRATTLKAVVAALAHTYWVDEAKLQQWAAPAGTLAAANHTWCQT